MLAPMAIFKGRYVLCIDSKGTFLGGLIGKVLRGKGKEFKLTSPSFCSGLPPWTMAEHHLYPMAFKEMVKTIWMIHDLRSAECDLWRIPIELILHIVSIVALYGNILKFDNNDLASHLTLQCAKKR